MGCGCKKRQEPVQQPVVNQQNQQINVAINESVSSQTQLTPEQQQQVNNIISKIENSQENQ